LNCLQVAARNVSGCVGMCRDVSGCVGMCRDVSQCVETGRANLLVPQELTSRTTLKRRIGCRLS